MWDTFVLSNNKRSGTIIVVLSMREHQGNIQQKVPRGGKRVNVPN